MTNKRDGGRVFKIRLLTFTLLFILAEIVLRIAGFKPGVLHNFYYQKGPVLYDSILYADEMGISHHVPGTFLFKNQKINDEGYFSDIQFTKEAIDSIKLSGKKIVMLVGDSYAEGCCADEYKNSYAGLLSHHPSFELLNFGVAGTDPLHYLLVVKKYVPILKPDLVLVNVYLGNDKMFYNRTPKPFIPVCYPVKNGAWLSSEAPIYLAPANTYFKNFNEVKSFYYTYFSLRSDQSTFFEKLIRPSIFLSRIYLYLKIKFKTRSMRYKRFNTPERPPYTYENLRQIQVYCKLFNTRVVFTSIPSPGDVIKKVDVRKKYDFLFNEIQWKTIDGLTPKDYDGRSDGNHFKNSGHKKYAIFLEDIILKELINSN